MHKCNWCNKEFQKKQSLNDHSREKHYGCIKCLKIFGEMEDYKKHNKDKHEKKTNKKNNMDKKSKDIKNDTVNKRTIDIKYALEDKPYYGYYLCNCGSFWTSGHAYKNYKQQCKKCKKGIIPYQLDEKYKSEDYSDSGYDNKQKPHMEYLCERCKKGMQCSGLNSSIY